MTRDSRLWWVMMIGSIILAVSSRMDLIDPLLPPEHTHKVHAAIELASLIIGILSGKLATSPLPLSDEGREKYADNPVKLGDE